MLSANPEQAYGSSMTSPQPKSAAGNEGAGGQAGSLTSEASIRLTPLRVEGDVGVYTDLAEDLYKRLRQAGAPVTYEHDGEHRRFVVQKSATAMALAFVGGVLVNAGYDVLKTALLAALGNRSLEQHVRVNFVVAGPNGDRTMFFEGRPADVRAAIEAADPPQGGAPTT